MDEESLITQQQTRRRLQQYVALFLSIILSAATTVLESYITREPYHTSILTGEGWWSYLLATLNVFAVSLESTILSLKPSSWTFRRWDMTTQDVGFHLKNSLQFSCMHLWQAWLSGTLESIFRGLMRQYHGEFSFYLSVHRYSSLLLQFQLFP